MSFQLPENMPNDKAALESLRAEAVEAFNSVYTDTPSAEEFADLKVIHDAVSKIDEALSQIVAEAEAANAEAEEKDNDDEAATRASEAAEMAAMMAETKTQEEPKEETQEEPKEEPKAAPTDFSKAATGKTPENIPAPKSKAGFRLTTSAKNYESGVIDAYRVAQEFNDLGKGGNSRVVSNSGKSQTTFAYFDRDAPEEFKATTPAEAIAAISRATDESRLQGGSLVAAGGWVAPSERDYSFLPVQAASGLLNLPQVTIRRGGITWPQEPDFSAIYDQIGFHQTEAQAIANTEKPCFEIPDVEWDELRMDVQGICITSNILQDHAWPELTQKFVDEAMRLHLHKISAWQIGKIVEGSTNVGTLTDVMFGTAGAVLSALELQVADMRARHRLGTEQSLEGVAPVWLHSIIRADLAYRQSVLPQQVTNAMINAHFANIGVNLQFVSDWQVGTGNTLGTGTAATAWPETVQVILYPAGTWWGAVDPVINLGIVHDSALLKQNKQIQMFTEDGVAVGKRGAESRIVTIPTSVDGTVGARYALSGGGEPAGE